MRFPFVLLVFFAVLTGCSAVGEFSTSPDERVEGYDALCAETVETQARCDAYDLAGRYYVAQGLMLAIVSNPNVSEDTKDDLKELDLAASDAVDAYVEAVIASGDAEVALRQAALYALLELQVALASN